MLAALALVLAATSADGCVRTDEQGRSFKTCFDPGNGLTLGAGLLGREGRGFTPAIRGGILLRTERGSVSKGTPWFNEHRLLLTRAQPEEAEKHLAVLLYQGVLRRHVEEGFILIPTSRPLRLPFPFDFALHVTAGRYERRVFEGPGFTLETGRVALLLDPVRSQGDRARLAFGPAIAHAVRFGESSDTHELSPFTSAVLDLGFESEDGWWSLRLEGLAGWAFTPGGEPWLRARVEGSIERVLLAVNDEPVWLTVEGSYALREAGVERRTEWAISAGLAVKLGGG